MSDSNLNPASVNKLESLLQHRPDKAELQAQNILPTSNLAPSLQAAEKDLARQQVQDKLSHALEKRPNVDELVQEGILKGGEIATE